MKHVLSKRALAAVAVLAATQVMVHPRAQAQQAFPDRPVHIVVPFLAGGSVDTVARLIGEKLGLRLGQQIVVENKAGAGGVVGAEYVARARADGHVLLLTPPGPLTTNAILVKSMPYDARKAFAPVSLVATLPNVLLTGPKRSGWTAEQVIKEAKEKPDQLTYGSQGIGTTGHLTGALFNQQTQAKLTHVAYKGFPPVLVDVIAGRVDLMFVDTANALPRVSNDSLIPLAIASKARVSSLPDVPTFVELGYPDLVSDTWFALMAPAGTPEAIRQRLRDEVAQVLEQPEVLAKLKQLGIETVGNQPNELDEHIRKEYERWRGVIQGAGLAPQ
jgi:tripartite-type tricarboxylate transporter receptor subunit TctC